VQTFIQDLQVVGNTTGTLFSVTQVGTVAMSVILNNAGVNPVLYDFQSSPDGANWTDIQSFGNPLNNTLLPGTQVQVVVAGSYQFVRLIGSASGGSTLDFSIARFFNRTSGGYCPLIAGL
jgi:hypothetical protein